MGKLSELLSSFQATNPVATFDKQGQSGAAKYKYASYNAIIEHLKPLAAKGLYWSHQVGGRETGDSYSYSLIVSTTIGAGDETRSSELVMAMPPNIQTMGSYITYAKRYQLVALCGMAADDDDDGANAVSEQGAKQVPKPNPRAAAKPVTTEPAPASSSPTRDTLDKAIAQIKKSPTARARQELLALVNTRVKEGKLTQEDYHEFGRAILTFVTDPDEATTNMLALFEVARDDKIIDGKTHDMLASLVNQRVHQLANMAKIGGTMKPGA